MRVFIFSLATLLIQSCSSQQVGGERDFYTWIDATGQMRTERREQPKPSVKESKGSLPNAAKDNQRTDESFNPEDFTPSEQVDKKLKGGRLYAWTEGSQQNVIEDIPGVAYQPEPVEANFKQEPYLTKSYRSFREGRELPFSEYVNKSLSLERYYTLNSQMNQDYILFELNVDRVAVLNFTSYVSKNRVALPTVVFLDSEFQSVSKEVLPFEDYKEESWSSYANLSGQAFWPKGAKYMLLTPTVEVGVVEVGDQVIKMVDLGKILIQ